MLSGAKRCAQRSSSATTSPIDHHRLLQDGDAEHAVVAKRLGPGRAIPGVAKIIAADELLLAFGERGVMADLDVHGTSFDESVIWN
jgi:hypothetical protein